MTAGAACARTEAATGLDAALTHDAGAADRGVEVTDAAPSPDLGTPEDGSTTSDAEPPLDAAASLDAEADAGTSEDAGGPSLTYKDDLHPMFLADGCSTFACHGSLVTVGGILVYMPDAPTAYADMLNRVSARRPEVLVRPGAPDESVLVEHAETTLLTNNIVTADQAALVRRWVAEGAVYERASSADAGVSSGDAGTAPATCTLEGATGLPVLPMACLPRCSTTTWARAVECRQAADPVTCQNGVFAMDTTPTVVVGGTQDELVLDCQQCLDWQSSSCLAELCLPEFLASQRCRGFRTNDPCTAENDALVACAQAHPEFTACQRMRDPMCVGP